MIVPAPCPPASPMLSAGIGDVLTALHKALLPVPMPACTAELQQPHPAFCPLYCHQGQEEGLRAHRHPANTVFYGQNINLGDADSSQTCSQHTHGHGKILHSTNLWPFPHNDATKPWIVQTESKSRELPGHNQTIPPISHVGEWMPTEYQEFNKNCFASACCLLSRAQEFCQELRTSTASPSYSGLLCIRGTCRIQPLTNNTEPFREQTRQCSSVFQGK